MKPSKIILGSAFLGMIVGAFCVPTWSAGVESAEVLSGIVQMPLDNPTYLYHTGVYSFWCIQLPAILLKLGLSPWAVSLLSSGFEGAVSFAAISACSLIFFRSGLTALMCSLLFTFMRFSTEHGYPVLVLPSVHHYGQMGMFSALLTLSLIALGYRRFGLLLLGLLPGVHASIALMAWTAAAFALFPERKEIWNQRKKLLSPFLIGVAFTALTLIIQKGLFPHPSIQVDHDVMKKLMSTFTQIWDPHRQPMKWINFRVDLCVLAYIFYRFKFQKNEVSGGEKLFLSGIVGMTFLAMGYCILYKIFPQQLSSSIFNTLMLKRWLNLNSMLLPLLAITLLSRLVIEEKSSLAVVTILVIIALTVFGPPTTLNMEGQNILRERHFLNLIWDAFYYKRIYFEVGLLIALVLPFIRKYDGPLPNKLAQLISILFILITISMSGWYFAKFRFAHFRKPEATSQEFIVTMYSQQRKEKNGVLIPCPGTPMFLQVGTSQGLLIDPQTLMQVSYAPSSIFRVQEILKSVYGAGLTVPKDRPRIEDGIDTEGIQNLWENRSVEEWRALRAKYSATGVLTQNSWKLQLPVFLEKNGYSLYEIPN